MTTKQAMDKLRAEFKFPLVPQKKGENFILLQSCDPDGVFFNAKHHNRTVKRGCAFCGGLSAYCDMCNFVPSLSESTELYSLPSAAIPNNSKLCDACVIIDSYKEQSTAVCKCGKSVCNSHGDVNRCIFCY